jgi:MFS transporter, DHA1 family, inner membrane transport protein
MKKSIYIMALGAFGIITTEFGIIGIMPAIAKHFNVSIDTAGWLLSGFALTIALTGPFSVLLTSKINRKLMMCLVLLTFVASNILSAVSPNFTVLMIARILPAFLHPVFWAVATVAASKQVEPKDAPKAVSVVLGGLSVATVLGVPITTYISELINWQASFYVSGAINLIAFAALLAFVPSMPVTENQSVKSQLVILKKGQMWVNLVATMVMIAGIFATYSFLAEYLGKISHMNGTEISLMLLLFGATGIAGNWITGIALSKNVMLTTRFFLLSLIGVHVLAYIFGGLFIPMTAIIGIWGFIHTGGFLIGQTRSTSEAPEAPELAASLMVSFGNAGVTLGTFLGGIIITRFGVHQVIWISILLLLVALALTYVFVGRKAAVTEQEQVQEEEQEAGEVLVAEPALEV